MATTVHVANCIYGVGDVVVVNGAHFTISHISYSTGELTLRQPTFWAHVFGYFYSEWIQLRWKMIEAIEELHELWAESVVELRSLRKGDKD